MKTLVVNFFAGAGAGKSTLAADTFAELKWKGINCELITEYAKKKVWEGTINTLQDQMYVFAKQNHSQFVCMDDNHELEVILTDSPILLSLIYAPEDMPKTFAPFVLDVFNSYNNMNFYVVRKKPYNPKGRMQDEGEAREIDTSVLDMLTKYNINFDTISGEKSSVEILANRIICATRFPK